MNDLACEPKPSMDAAAALARLETVCKEDANIVFQWFKTARDQMIEMAQVIDSYAEQEESKQVVLNASTTALEDTLRERTRELDNALSEVRAANEREREMRNALMRIVGVLAEQSPIEGLEIVKRPPDVLVGEIRQILGPFCVKS
jgi:hypothetical protein